MPGENKLGVMPISKLIWNMSLPIIASMLVQALYNIVDSVFVSWVSEASLTAVSLAFPAQNLMISLGAGTAVGVNALMGRALGAGERDRANRVAVNGLFLALVAFVLCSVLGLTCAEAFLRSQTKVEEIVQMGAQYLNIVMGCSFGLFGQIMLERLLQGTGRSLLSMYTQGLGAIINIILDPVFIHGWWGMPKMGVAGAAVATVIGQCTGAVLGIYLNLRHNPEVQLHVKFMKPNWKGIAPILEVGIPSVVMNGIGSVMNFGMNQILQGFNEVATGVFGIYYKLQSLFFMPLFGINNATISILAFNYGARKPKRIVHTLKLATAVAVCIMLVGLAVFQLFPQALLGIFNPTEEFLAIGVKALRILCLPFPVAAICIALGASFQALGKGSYSTIVSLCRQLIVLLPVAYLLSLTGDVNNVWWSFPIAEVMSALVTGLLFGRLYRRKVKPLFEDAAE